MLRRSTNRPRRGLRAAAWRTAGAVLAVGGLALVCAPGLGSVAGAAKSSKAPLYIGSVLGLSGPFAGFDTPQYYGLKTIVNELNKKGGILGHKLVYVNINDDSQTTKFGPGIQQLLQEHKYLAVFPTPVGFQTQLTYTNAEHIITFDGGTPVNTQFNPQKYPYDFNDAPLVTDQLKYVAEALKKWSGPGPAKVGIIVNSLTASEAEMTHLSKVLQAQGVTVLPIVTVAPTATDVSVQLGQLQSQGATVIYPFPNDALCTATFTGVETIGWKVRVLGNADCLNATVVKSIPSTVMPEVRFFSVSSTMLAANGKPRPRIAAFAKAVFKADPTAAAGIAGVSADAIHDLQWAAERAKSVTEAKVFKALNSMHKADIPASTFFQEPNPRWSPTDHVMDHATFNGYYGMANVSAPPVTGFWKQTTTLSVKSSK